VKRALAAVALVLLLGVGLRPEHAQCFLTDTQGSPQPPMCDRPDSWNCGTVEHACSRTGHKVQGDDTENWHACACQQKCLNDGSRDNSPGSWQKRCKARCRQDHCHCPTACQSTE
jgi:hypothetical protein